MTPLSNIKLYYFDFPARVEFLRLLLEDANIEYEFNKIPVSQWPKKKAELAAEGIPVPTLPYILINGRHMGKTIPTMRYISKNLGKYMADTELDNHDLDSLADLCNDWYSSWVIAHYLTKPNDRSEEEYQTKKGPMYHDGIEKELGKRGGPYLFGEKITYVDFLIYHNIVDDKLRKKLSDTNYPNLKKLAEAMENRPSLKKYFSEDK